MTEPKRPKKTTPEDRLMEQRLRALKRLGYSRPPPRHGLVYCSTAAELLRVTTQALRGMLDPATATVNRHHRSGPPALLYCPIKLERLSKSKKCEEARQRRSPERRAAARRGVNTKTERLLDLVERMPITVVRLPKEEVLRRALAGNEERRMASETEEDFEARMVWNFLRHECTDYDSVVDALVAQVGKDDARRRLRERILEVIESAYPEFCFIGVDRHRD